MGMFGPKEGTAGFSSKKDPRFRTSWRQCGLVSSFDHGPAKEKLDELKAAYGEPPDDLEIWFFKD